MNRRVGIALLVLGILVIVGAGVVVITRLTSVPQATKPRPREAPPLETVGAQTWGESHRAFQMFAPARDGDRSDKYLSFVIAELPDSLATNGTTFHMRVAVPEWLVFDQNGKVNPYADGMLLTISNPDVGIGLELTRIELNAHARPEDRRWHEVVVKVPPCTRHVAIEAHPGVEADANNAYDQIFVSVQEPIVFKNGVLAAQLSQACPEGGLLSGCEPPAPLPGCEAEGGTLVGRESGSALRTHGR